MHVGTGISAKQGMISISETKRNHMGQGLGNTRGEAKQLLFLSSKKHGQNYFEIHAQMAQSYGPDMLIYLTVKCDLDLQPT